MPNRDRQIVVMGVMGAGKTTIGVALSQRLACPFFDADDLHSDVNRRKLSGGIALSEADRQPWVERIAALIRELHEKETTAVIACSALTQAVRSTLAAASEGVIFVHLEAETEAIRTRLVARQGHFANPALLQSQYETLEPPEDAIVVDATARPEQIVERIVQRLKASTEEGRRMKAEG